MYFKNNIYLNSKNFNNKSCIESINILAKYLVEFVFNYQKHFIYINWLIKDHSHDQNFFKICQTIDSLTSTIKKTEFIEDINILYLEFINDEKNNIYRREVLKEGSVGFF
ncbi:hypothetical protein EDEG_02655 [Edhazardia aedis USNM 41457]|uniref:Uncharacterized protein n=1 Tax=Edhazardia aedis (strain USNM 41457) TaxID=1003232 RepID=J9DK19_EDHAE|nr:hypothetical protein EDEG_02655 [Edhazardia aedis USNM 41457]|eukprot:EJW02960.1 hypothetical protein EDEG_02655 [Edhazardia aedis USNM 41457]